MPDPHPAPRFRQRAAKMSELVARQVVEDIVAEDGARAEELMRAHMVALVAHLERDYAGLRDEIVGW